MMLTREMGLGQRQKLHSFTCRIKENSDKVTGAVAIGFDYTRYSIKYHTVLQYLVSISLNATAQYNIVNVTRSSYAEKN